MLAFLEARCRWHPYSVLTTCPVSRRSLSTPAATCTCCSPLRGLHRLSQLCSATFHRRRCVRWCLAGFVLAVECYYAVARRTRSPNRRTARSDGTCPLRCEAGAPPPG